MEITWHGLSCFTLKGDSARVVIDPYDPKHAGLKKAPKLEGEIVLANAENKMHDPKLVAGNPKVFNMLGEYEASGVVVTGVRAFDHPESDEMKEAKEGKVILFVIDIDGFRVCHLSNIGHKLSDEMTESLGDIDILLVPVGGNNLSAEKAHEIIEQIEPRMVIPMYYESDGIKFEGSKTLDAFIKETGLAAGTREKKLKLKDPKALSNEKTDFVVMEAVV